MHPSPYGGFGDEMSYGAPGVVGYGQGQQYAPAPAATFESFPSYQGGYGGGGASPVHMAPQSYAAPGGLTSAYSSTSIAQYDQRLPQASPPYPAYDAPQGGLTRSQSYGQRPPPPGRAARAPQQPPPSNLSRQNLNRMNPQSRPQADQWDTVSTGSRASTVGSQWECLTQDGPYTQKQRSKAPKVDGVGVVPRPSGRRMALLVGINPRPGSKAATNSVKHMSQFLQRNNYICETVIFRNDPEQLEADLEQGVNEMIGMAQQGDAVFFHCIGYGAFQGQDLSDHLTRLVTGLGEGVRLTCVLDCCYCPAKPAFRVDRKAKRNTRRAGKLAVSMGPSDPVPAHVFAFIGDCEGDQHEIASYRSMDGNICAFTAAVMLAMNKKDLAGYWNAPPTYSELSKIIAHEVAEVSGGQRWSLRSQIRTSDAYDIDQPAWL